MTHDSKDITFALCQIHIGFGFFPFTWPSFPISTLLWRQHEDTVGTGKTQELSLLPLLPSHSTSKPVLSAQEQHTCGALSTQWLHTTASPCLHLSRGSRCTHTQVVRGSLLPFQPVLHQSYPLLWNSDHAPQTFQGLPVALRKFFKVFPRAYELPPSSLPHCWSHGIWIAEGLSTCSTLSLKCSSPTFTELIVTSSGRHTHSTFPDHPSSQPHHL